MERKDEVVSIARTLFCAGVTAAQVPINSTAHLWSTFRLEVAEKMVKVMEDEGFNLDSRNTYLENENRDLLHNVRELHKQLSRQVVITTPPTPSPSACSPSACSEQLEDYAGWTRRIEAQERRMDVHLRKHV